MLQQLHNEEMMKLENNYEKQITEINHENKLKVEKLRNEYEVKILDMKKSFEKSLERKDEQIKKLEVTVQKQCVEMEREVTFIRNHLNKNKMVDQHNYIEKIRTLEKCIIKMDKLFKKSEKDYQRKISKLKKQIDLRDKVNEVRNI